MAFYTGQSWPVLNLGTLLGALTKDFGSLCADGLNQSLISSVVKARKCRPKPESNGNGNAMLYTTFCAVLNLYVLTFLTFKSMDYQNNNHLIKRS